MIYISISKWTINVFIYIIFDELKQIYDLYEISNQHISFNIDSSDIMFDQNVHNSHQILNFLLKTLFKSHNTFLKIEY